VFSALKAEPEKKWAHILRWYKHIASFGAASASFPAPAAPVAAPVATEAAPAKAAPAAAAEDDDDVDLFGEETEEEKAANEARKKAAEETKKAGPVGRSAVILDVKPWGEETDMAVLESKVRSIATEGLEWKAGQLLPIAFGVKKLQIMCHIVDDLVSVDEDIIRRIEEFEDEVQSVDTFAFNKL
jgi:elongation factor 1-beta